MIRSLISGVSGMQQFQEEIDVIGNNIANVNTTAFKSSRATFADALSQTYQAGSAARGTASNTASMQVGTGVKVNAIRSDFNQGTMARTEVGTDLFISGSGYFMVRDPLNDLQYVTRAGDFQLDNTGRLVTAGGMRVQGFSDAALATRGDITIDPTGAPATAAPGANVESFRIDKEGYVRVRLSDQTEFVRGQVLLQNFRDPQALVKEGGNLYSNMAVAGPLAASAGPGTLGLGKIEAGALELSNVNLAEEFTGLITTQRAFQASARIISTSDDMLQELVNLKR